MSGLAEKARKRLPASTYDFVAAGAGDERTLVANEAAWRAYEVLPHVVAGTGRADTTTTILGREVRTPILLAPAGRQRALHPDGEMAAAAAARDAGSIYCLATSATTDLHDIVTVGARTWLQLYVSTDRDWTSMVVSEAQAHGFEQIVVTVDRPTEAYRPRSARHGGLGPLPAGVHVTSHRGDGSTRSSEPGVWDPSLSWADVSAMKEETSLPIAVKGVLRADDARRAVDAGVDAIVVSNHGGRQIDGSIPTARALPRVLDAVHGAVPVYVDGGIRSGGDVFRALALGADAALVGRPYLWALADGGQAGVLNLLGRMNAELAELMSLAGCGSIDDITPDLIEIAPATRCP
jgi:4-hydroxymandelate oxidase